MSESIAFELNLTRRRLAMNEHLACADALQLLGLQVKSSEKILVDLEARLSTAETHQDTSRLRHLTFLIHLRKEKLDAQVEKLKRLKNEQDLRYLGLEAFVERYVQDNEVKESLLDLSPEDQARHAHLKQEQETWEKLIVQVRERMKKNPQNLQLPRLLAEHQARLLSTQDELSALEGRTYDDETVFEKVEKTVDLESLSPEMQKIQKELALLEGLYVKTQQRLESKPELIHLKQLLKQQEWRIQTLKQSFQAGLEKA